jgi:hypothetical protein
MTVRPPTTTGVATVAGKVSPLLLILEPTACPSRTVIMVPAGITTGVASNRLSGLGAGCAPGLTGWEEVLAASEEVDCPELSLAGCGLLQATSAASKKHKTRAWYRFVIKIPPPHKLQLQEHNLHRNRGT